MISKRNNKAFTLAEIMIVLLILTILFALLAPMFAKKMTKDKGSVWNWVDTNSTYSAYFDGDYESDHNLLSEAFFGMAPDSESSAEYDPYSKIVLRAYDHRGKVQKHINFRYGYDPIENDLTTDDREQIRSIGNNVGTMLLDTQNILVGGSYDYMYATAQDRTIPLRNNSSATRHFSLYPTNNITFGNEAKDDIVRKTFTRYQRPERYTLENGEERYHYWINESPSDASSNNDDVFRETRSVGNIAIGFRAGKNDSRARVNDQEYSSLDDNFNKFGYNYTDNIYIGYNAGYISDFRSDNDWDPIYYTPYIPKDESGTKYPEIIGQTIIGSNAGLNNMGILNTIIGSNAGKNFRGTNNVFIGSNAGGFESFVGLRHGTDDSVQWEEVSNNVAIGYKALSNLEAIEGLGQTLIYDYPEGGCLPGDDHINNRCERRKEIYKHYNNNIAIGAHALENLRAGYNNVAIGYNACSNLVHSANKICIGANSGPGYDDGVTRFFESFDGSITPTEKPDDSHLYDITQRIYIGAKPKHFGGDAVLEIHDSNVQYGAGNLKSFLINEPTISRANTTTIVNGNLVVRGKVFFTVGDNLYNFSTVGYKPTETPSAGPRPQYAFDEQDYYILGSTVNEGSIVCAANPLTYTFGGVYNGEMQYDSTNFSLGCPRIYYNPDQNDEFPGPEFNFYAHGDDRVMSVSAPNSFGYKSLSAEYIYETASDRRLKNIGSKSKAGLAEIMKLKVFNYKYKDDEKKIPHVGVIAQDLMKIFPNSVITGKDGFLSIKLEEMFYAAINAIKDLDKIIVSHTKRVLKLESTISKLEAENADLKSQVEALTTRVNKIKASRRL